MDEIDAKSFVDRVYRPRATPSEVDTALQYAGFTEIHIDFHPPYKPGNQEYPNGDGYWAVICHKEGTLASVTQEIMAVLNDLNLYVEGDNDIHVSDHYPKQRSGRGVTVSIPGNMLEAETSESARALVAALLEDIDADLPSHKSEVRILPTSDPRRFDVTLLTGFDPVYIGTLGYQGSVWKPVEVMPGVGRELRAKLHFVGPDKESVAMTMVQTLRPVWKRKIQPHLMAQVESEDFDAKAFVQQKISIEKDIKRVIETNYPNIEVLSVADKTGDGYSMKYEALIKSRDGNQLWHSPIYNLIQDIEVKLADVYGWKLRPYMNQKKYPEFRRTGKPVGIKPIGISYNNTGTPGVFVLYFDFNIMRRSTEGRGDFDPQADWGTPYGSPGEQERNESSGIEYVDHTRYIRRVLESPAEEIAKEAAKAEKPASPEQAEAGNYKKGHVCVQGLEIAIENAEGSTRSGTGKDGKTWKVTMPAHYGYIKGTQGKDKDHLDVYIGPKPGGMMAFVVNQQKEDTKGFDEHKIMLGFATKDEAIETYDRAFSGDLGPKLRQSVVSTTVDKLKEWIASGNTKKPFEGLVESLLEDEGEEEFGFQQLKALVMRVAAGVPPGTEFHIGFAIHTSSQYEIEARANDDAIEVDWDAVNAAIPIIERNAMKALDEQGIRCRDEGHNGTDELIGSAWVEAGTGAVAIMKEFIDRDEPFSTTTGTIDHIQQGLALNVYRGVPEQIAALIDVGISFFDLDTLKKDEMDGGLGLGESDDSKALAMRTPMREPKTYAELKKGDVYYDETGAFNRVDGFGHGYVGSYQDETGKLIHTGVPGELVLISQFSPCYAYGHYVQKESRPRRSGFLGAQLVDVADSSDAALWKLVDDDMIKDGRHTPETLQADRDRHNAWLAEPQQVAGREARERMNQMMGRLPEPPVDESEESDPKKLALRATAGLSPDTMIKFQCPFTSQGQTQPRPYYFSDDLGDWASPEDGGWSRAEAFRLGDYIKDGVLDLNDLPFGCESIIVVNPDGSPGQEYSIEDLGMGTAEVIDTYEPPDGRDIEFGY